MKTFVGECELGLTRKDLLSLLQIGLDQKWGGYECGPTVSEVRMYPDRKYCIRLILNKKKEQVKPPEKPE